MDLAQDELLGDVWFLSEEEEQALAVGLALQYGSVLVSHEVHEIHGMVVLEVVLSHKPESWWGDLDIAGLSWEYRGSDYELTAGFLRVYYHRPKRVSS